MDTRLTVRVFGAEALSQIVDLLGSDLHGWLVKSADVVNGESACVDVTMLSGDVDVVDDVVELLRSLIVGDDVRVTWVSWDRRSAPVSLAGLEL